jgi:CHASE1-domain containing sensor protein
MAGLYMTLYLNHYDITSVSSVGPSGDPDDMESIDHSLIGRYRLDQAFPSNITAPLFAYDNEEMQTFDVTFEHLDMQFILPEQIS